MLNINNKPWYKLRATDITKFLCDVEDETFFYEFKEDDVSNDHFINEVSAFANTYGGYIFLGIDNNKQIKGCCRWTEQRIHSVMHDCITPMPNFDVKKFKLGTCKIFVVRVDEGALPPYITNKGKIFERVSSGSFVIKDSTKLSQIYYKREEQLKNIERKISLDPLPINKDTPNNLCAYLDFGFSTIFSEETILEKDYLNFDFQPICDYLNSLNTPHSISRVGASFLISFGGLNANTDLISAGLHNFIEIMRDGSVKGRIILSAFGQQPQTMVDIYSLLYIIDVFKKIYSRIFDKPLFKSFIYAQKYEKLVVLKQFTPFYNVRFDSPDYELVRKYLGKHIKKYGNNLIIIGGRYPYTGFQVIDKEFFEGLETYNYENLISRFFPYAYSTLGYIDPIK